VANAEMRLTICDAAFGTGLANLLPATLWPVAAGVSLVWPCNSFRRYGTGERRCRRAPCYL
jgi:hypothetical protein